MLAPELKVHRSPKGPFFGHTPSRADAAILTLSPPSRLRRRRPNEVTAGASSAFVLPPSRPTDRRGGATHRGPRRNSLFHSACKVDELIACRGGGFPALRKEGGGGTRVSPPLRGGCSDNRMARREPRAVRPPARFDEGEDGSRAVKVRAVAFFLSPFLPLRPLPPTAALHALYSCPRPPLRSVQPTRRARAAPPTLARAWGQSAIPLPRRASSNRITTFDSQPQIYEFL